MKLNTGALLVLSLMAGAIATEPLPVVEDTSNLQLNDAHTPSNLAQEAGATCPAGYPKYCPKWNWCCTKRAVGCCRLSCCAPGSRYCGANGHCYK